MDESTIINLRKLHALGLLNLSVLRLWLALLILGAAFWTLGQLMTLRILGRSYETSRYVITNIQLEDITQDSITTIRVEICNQSGTSEVTVISDEGDRKYQFDLTVPEKIEGEIAKELNIPREDVSRLVHYKVRNPPSS